MTHSLKPSRLPNRQVATTFVISTPPIENCCFLDVIFFDDIPNVYLPSLSSHKMAWIPLQLPRSPEKLIAVAMSSEPCALTTPCGILMVDRAFVELVEAFCLFCWRRELNQYLLRRGVWGWGMVSKLRKWVSFPRKPRIIELSLSRIGLLMSAHTVSLLRRSSCYGGGDHVLPHLSRS